MRSHAPALPRPRALPLGASLVLAFALALGAAPESAGAQTDELFACYVPLTGTVYRIRAPGTRPECVSSGHVEFSWFAGSGVIAVGDAAGGDLDGAFPDPRVVGLLGRALAETTPTAGQVLVFDGSEWTPATPVEGGASDHGALDGLADDDHPQYLPVDGSRPLEGNLDAGGNRITELGAATSPGEAVPFEQAVKVGQAAGGDLDGTFPDPTVAGLRGRAVADVAPARGQVLAFDGTRWAPTAPAGLSSDPALLQAVEERTRALQSENGRLRAALAELETRLRALEAAVGGRDRREEDRRER